VSSIVDNPSNYARVDVRAASSADVRAIAEFQTGCWREAYVALVPQSHLDRLDADAREARWHERVAAGTRNVAVGFVVAKLAGVVSWGTCAEKGVPRCNSRVSTW
jgi:hypothetical protein